VFALHHYSNAARVPEIREGCASGALGCVACKTELADPLNAFLRPARERRASIDRARVDAILRDGSARAREVANATLRDVRRAMKLTG
jgi:tryptophanyl-tRNA synthetase